MIFLIFSPTVTNLLVRRDSDSQEGKGEDMDPSREMTGQRASEEGEKEESKVEEASPWTSEQTGLWMVVRKEQ